jgi:hypothetical protein
MLDDIPTVDELKFTEDEWRTLNDEYKLVNKNNTKE